MAISPSDYHELKAISGIDIAPDGSRVAYVTRTPENERKYRSSIHTVSVSGGESRQLTHTASRDTDPRWSPDGDSIAFLRTREKNERPQLWLLPMAGGEAKRLTDVIGAVSDPTWSPDGRYLAFTQEVTHGERENKLDRDRNPTPEYERETPDPRVIGSLVYREHQQYRDGRRRHVYLYDLETGSVRRVTDGQYDHENPEWGDAETLYYTTQRTGDPDDNLVHDIVAYDIESGEQSTVTQTTGWDASFSATTDGRVAFLYSNNEEPGPSMHLTDIRVIDRQTDQIQTVTDSLSRRVYRGSTPVWGPDEERLYFLVPDQGQVNIYRCQPGTEPTAIETPGTVHIDEISVDGGTIAFTQSTARFPDDLSTVGTDGGTPKRLTQINEAYLADRSIQEPEEVWIETEDGTEIQGWILTPPNFSPEESYPAILEIHGGPMIMWTTSGTMFHEFQLLAAAGYVVAWCNPRGSTGYGEAHTTAIADDWGGPDYRDLMAFTDALVDRPAVDSSNLFVTGGSFGGFMTSWIVGHTDRFSGAVTQRGVYDQIAQFGGTDTYHANEKQMGVPWEKPMEYWKASPVAYADQVSTPTLIMHSERDFRVPIHNADMLFRFYRKNGVETRYIRYPRDGHELSRSGEPGHAVDRLQRIVRWFNGYSAYHDQPPVVETAERPVDWEPQNSAE